LLSCLLNSIGSEIFAKNALNVILKYNNSRILLNKKVTRILYDEKQNKVYEWSLMMENKLLQKMLLLQIVI